MKGVEDSPEHIFLRTGELEAIIVPKRAGAPVAQLHQEATLRTGLVRNPGS